MRKRCFGIRAKSVPLGRTGGSVRWCFRLCPAATHSRDRQNRFSTRPAPPIAHVRRTPSRCPASTSSATPEARNGTFRRMPQTVGACRSPAVKQKIARLALDQQTAPPRRFCRPASRLPNRRSGAGRPRWRDGRQCSSIPEFARDCRRFSASSRPPQVATPMRPAASSLSIQV